MRQQRAFISKLKQIKFLTWTKFVNWKLVADSEKDLGRGVFQVGMKDRQKQNY